MENRNIVVAGAGYGGITAALRLEKLFRPFPQFRIHLVDKNPYHSLKTRLHEAAVYKREVTIDIRRVTHNHRIIFHLGLLSGINPAQRALKIGSQELRYDYLVLAVGSQANYYNIPGLRQHSFPLQNADDADKIYRHISKLCTHASIESSESARRNMLRFVIGGGGFSGIEFAAELGDRVERLVNNHSLNQSEAEIIVIDPSNGMFSSLDMSLRSRVYKKLLDKGIAIHTNTSIVNAIDHKVVISNNAVIPTSTIIWTGGSRIAKLLEESGVSTDMIGRIKVDKYLRSPDFINIYAIGDNAYIFNPRTGKPVPAAAQFALQQGRIVAENIFAAVFGYNLQPYKPSVIGEVMSLCRHLEIGWSALPFVKKVGFIGFLARLLKTAIQEKHIKLLKKTSRSWIIT